MTGGATVEQRVPEDQGRRGSRAPRRRAVARRVRIGAIALLAMVGVTTAVAVRPAAHAGESGLRLDHGGLARLAELVTEAPEDFAGVTIDPATGVVSIRYPSGRGQRPAWDRVADIAAAPAAQAQGGTRAGARDLTALPGGPERPVTFVASKYSLRELTAVEDRITADRSWLPGADRILTRWGVDEATNTVPVGLSEITPEAVEAADRTFGDRVQLVVNDCYVFQGGAVTCDVSAVSSPTTRLADFGDSGGPMIMYRDDETDSGPAFAMGMILGGGNDGTGREVLFHETRMAIPPGWRLVTSDI